MADHRRLSAERSIMPGAGAEIVNLAMSALAKETQRFNEEFQKQKRLAEITWVSFSKKKVICIYLNIYTYRELIHTASLLHDDVIDESDTRRGVESANSRFGNKLAVLSGDFLLARASVALARLRSLQVVELMSTVIEHLVRGEVMQMKRAVALEELAARNKKTRAVSVLE